MTIKYRRRGSFVFKDDHKPGLPEEMDIALGRGDDLWYVAKTLDTTVAALERHICERVATGEWRFDGRRLVKVNRSMRKRRQVQKI